MDPVGRVLGNSIKKGSVVGDAKVPTWTIGDWDGLLARLRGSAWFILRWFWLRASFRAMLCFERMRVVSGVRDVFGLR